MKRNLLLLTLSLSSVCMWGQKVNDVDMTAERICDIDFMKASMQLTNGQKMAFSGFDNLNADEMLQPDFFEIESGSEATFTGSDGKYSFYFNPSDNVMFVIKDDANYPDALWIIGQGFGHPKALKANAGWKLEAPLAMQAKKTGDDVYELTMYLENGFDFLSKSHSDWDVSHNLAGNKMFPWPEGEVQMNFYIGDNGNSHFCGDFMSDEKFVAGVYTVKFDLKSGNCVFQKEGEPPVEFVSSRIINGVEGTNTQCSKNNGEKIVDYMYWDLDLKQGQNMNFQGFKRLNLMLQPEYFTNYSGTWVFNAPDGNYRIWFIKEDKAIYCERLDKNTLADGIVVMTGANYIHPVKNGTFCDNMRANWGYELPSDYVFCVPKENGVHETYLYLEPDFMIRGYEGKGSWSDPINGKTYTMTGDLADKQNIGWDNLGLADDKKAEFTPGTFHVLIDTNNKTANFERVNMAEVNGVHSDPTGVEEVLDAEKTIVGVYTITGVKVTDTDNLAKGIYVITYSDGSSKKVIN